MDLKGAAAQRLIVGTVATVIVLVGLALATQRPTVVPRPSPLPAVSAPATRPSDLFVAPSGNDAAAGSRDAPLATLQAAIDRVAPGNTVWVQPGTYAGFRFTAAGLPDRPTTVAAVRNGTVTLTPPAGGATISLERAANVSIVNLTVAGPAGFQDGAVRVERSTGIVIEGSTIEGARHGFGIEIRFSSDVTIRENDIRHNAIGVRLFGEGDPASVRDVRIEDNRIHDSDSMVLDDSRPNNDYGANGIVWHEVTGPTVARDNELWANRATSTDYGHDGGAFEIWGSSNIEITRNVAWDNENVVETGSDGPPCANLAFTHNVAFAPTFGVGLILRCAEDGLVANNVLDGLRSYAFELSDRTAGNRFATSIEGLRILNNIVVGSVVYVVTTELPASVVLDNNLATPGHPVARLPRGVTIRTFADLAARIGRDQHSIVADPRFVDAAAHDYRLQPASPAIDRGTVAIPEASFEGTAPDIGAFEGPAAVPTATAGPSG